MTGTLRPMPPLEFVEGPAITDAAALERWLVARRGDRRQVRLPVRMDFDGINPRGFEVGPHAIQVRDAALGIALADHVRREAAGQPSCTLWLEGRIDAQGDLQLRRVGARVEAPDAARARVALEADRVEGRAFDGKGGALVVTDAGAAIYVEGLDAWPSELHGQRVVVHGRLANKQHIPAPTIDEQGAISQGAEGLQSVIESARWQALT